MVASAEGIDLSSFQNPVGASALRGLSFASARVSNWSGAGMGVDPHFAANWAAFKTAGVHRLAYWFLLLTPSAASQARFFVNAVQAQGLRAGDILVCDSEIEDPAMGPATHAFCSAVEAAVPAGVIVVVYANHACGRFLGSSTGWPLWFAWPEASPPPPLMIAPWAHWTFWQWGTRFVAGAGTCDADAFNGTASELDAWVAARQPHPKPKPPRQNPCVLMSGDDVIYLPNGAGATAAFNVPAGVTDLQATSNSPASLQYMLDGSGVWVPWPIDYTRSPNSVSVTGAKVVKVQRTDTGSGLVSVNFA